MFSAIYNTKEVEIIWNKAKWSESFIYLIVGIKRKREELKEKGRKRKE